MSCENPTDRGSINAATAVQEDAIVEAGVLGFLLEEHPAQLTITELSLVLNGESSDFARNDAVERAVRDLVGAGLLHCQGAFVVPSRAALYLHDLEVG